MTIDKTALERLLEERRRADAAASAEPAVKAPAPVAAPSIAPDSEAEQKRIEAAERLLCARLHRNLERQRMLDRLTQEQARARLERRQWEAGSDWTWDSAEIQNSTKGRN